MTKNMQLNYNRSKKCLTISMLFLLNLILFSACNEVSEEFQAGVLKCEYMVNPLGIDKSNPRFTWQMIDSLKGAEQSAYQIYMGEDSSEVSHRIADVWNSGKTYSDKNLVVYEGGPLKPFTRYYWCVEIWDGNGNHSLNSPVAFFETGMIDSKNWRGTWISDSRDIDLKPAPYFRKEFIPHGKVKSARLYIAAAGLYEYYINGTRVGDHRLDPAYTRFDRRTLYLSYDITHLIRTGSNAMGVILGNGWYNHQSTAVWYFDKAPWRARPKFCSDLRIIYDDGTSETVSTGTDWKTSAAPVIFNSIYTGEHFDSRLMQDGWNIPGFDDSKWGNAIPVAAPSQNIVSQVMHPIRITEEIQPESLKQLNENTWLFDLGRNIAGVSSLKVTGKAGTVIRMKHAERLNNKGFADQSNIDVHYRPTDDKDPFGTDIFILSGNREESFMPLFNYKGFQYVEVSSDKPVLLTKESLTGYFMHSDVPVAGNIQSSNPVLDKIWRATNNSYLSNLFGYPTDCPQREKNGWTGDAHIAIETGLYNFDGITIYEKWLADHSDEQQPNGILPAIIPSSGWGYTWANGPDWTSTIAIIPWNIYLFYGDSYLLEKYYDNIKRYIDHITEISTDGLTDWGLGDWIPIKSVASRELTSSVYYFTDVTILAKAAKLFGKQADCIKYTELASGIKDAINGKYLNKEKAIYGKGLQTELAVPLQWGIVPEDMKAKVAAKLAESISLNNNHMDVGLLGTKAILNALSENGFSDLAYTLASQETFPSWGWWIVNGATTLYENWPLDTKSDISMNHIMFGEIGAWMYKGPGGIFPDETNPGFKNVVLKPNFVRGLGHFEAKHDGPYGTIISSWKRDGNKVEYKVVIPANSTATLYLKAPEIVENNRKLSENKFIKIFNEADGQLKLFLKSGTYLFTLTN
jgi:alpha-L-rhamnosidase